MNTDTTTDQAVIDRDAEIVKAAIALLLTDSDVLESISDLGVEAIDYGNELYYLASTLELEGTYDSHGAFWVARLAEFETRVRTIAANPIPSPVEQNVPCADCGKAALPTLLMSMDLTEIKGGYYRCEEHGFFGHFGICVPSAKVA